MICKRCGSQIFNNAKTCPFCAAVVGAENETDLTQNVIPSLEEIENPGNQMPDLTAPVQPPAAPVTPPAQPNSFDTPAVQPVQQNPFDIPAVQPPAQNNPFSTPAVQPPAQNNPFGTPAVQPPAQNNSFDTPAVQPPARQNPFGDPAVQPPVQNNPFGNPQQSAAMTQNTAQSSFAPLPPLSGSGGATGSSIAGVPIRLITKIVIVLALLAFALPFVTVSCSMGEYGEQEIATYSGFALMMGNLEYEDPAKQMNDSLSGMFGEEFVNNEDEDEISDFDAIFNQGDEDALIGYHDTKEDSDAAAAEAEAEAGEDTQRKNYYLIGAFICGVIGLVLFFIRDKKLELFTMLLCMVSALLTLLSSITFSSFYHVTDDAQMAELIRVKSRYGLFTVVVLFIIGAVGALKEHIDVNRNSGY